MSTQQAVARPAIEPLPERLSSPSAKLVYFYLDATGSATLDELQTTLRLQKISLLSVLRSLDDDGLVDRDGDTYVAS
ncbi:MarR family transcriptional regulator [Haloarchaeobius sp. HRN-SO-5]|uniref:MarR family transcriptional regulator n=1 Tax=Haloarchaeobius sp. HRN-SO-5 TaxID=3446118 RepID=UPI003EB8BBAF